VILDDDHPKPWKEGLRDAAFAADVVSTGPAHPERKIKTRTAAIEAAVECLVEADQQENDRKRRALDAVFGALHLGIDRERWEAAELDRLEFEIEKHSR
jgi:hypothetical protein